MERSVPLDRFRAYYKLGHWSIPPLSDLTSFAEQTSRQIFPHFDMFHMPTFRLDMQATCLAFTICLVGAIHGSDMRWDYASGVRNEMTTVLMRVSQTHACRC